MHLNILLIVATAALSTQVLATGTKSHSTKSHSKSFGSSFSTSSYKPTSTPTSTTSAPVPTDTYAHGRPLCATPGYTVVPGNYTETIQQQSGSDLKCCLDQCIADKGDAAAGREKCLSIAFHARYTECLFFDRVVEETQLEVDETSEFLHYDLECQIA